MKLKMLQLSVNWAEAAAAGITLAAVVVGRLVVVVILLLLPIFGFCLILGVMTSLLLYLFVLWVEMMTLFLKGFLVVTFTDFLMLPVACSHGEMTSFWLKFSS